MVLAAAACGGGGAGTGDDDDGQADGGIDAAVDGAVPEGWTMLIERSWQLPDSPTEAYKCRRIQITEDTYIGGFRAMSPTGTHHEVLTISTGPVSPVGNYECDSQSNDPQVLFGGGIASNDFELPPGVAIKLPAGSYINIDLHLLNHTDGSLSGTSGIYVKTVAPADVVHEADMMFVGDRRFTIPATGTPYAVTGDCTAPVDWHIVNLWPHMHSYATHQKVTITSGGTVLDTLLDTDYSYQEQKNYPQSDVVVQTNDTLHVECTYVNDTGYPIDYGEGAAGEMCYAGFYKYPAGGDPYGCAPVN